MKMRLIHKTPLCRAWKNSIQKIVSVGPPITTFRFAYHADLAISRNIRLFKKHAWLGPIHFNQTVTMDSAVLVIYHLQPMSRTGNY